MPSKRKTTSEANNAPSASPADSNATSTVPVKRQRVSRACDQCRAAREKCDGKQPVCFPCEFQKRTCTYQSNPKKRGVQTGYIKTLEVALAWLFDKVPGTEDALENILMHDGGQGQSFLVGKESERSNRLHKKWGQSKVQKEIDRILSGGHAVRADKSSPSDNDESDTVHRAKSAPLKVQDSNLAAGRMPSGNGPSLKPNNGHGGPHTTPELTKLPTGHWRLLDIYLSYTHCWFPILEKQDLLKTVYLYPSEGLDIPRTSTASASHAELWAALALASYQDASSARPSDRGASTGSNHTPDELYSIARSLIPSEEGEFDIQHARALLLLALVNIGREKKTSAWFLNGLARRIVLNMSEIQRSEEPQSKRTTAVLMGCCILDTFVSVHQRGMPGLEAAAVMEDMSIPEDSLDEWQPWQPCDGFGQDPSVPAIPSRSPAYSLTTFNQLYDVFSFLGKRSMPRRDDPLHAEHPAEVMMLLHRTIKLRLPFGNFITGRNCGSATIPSAYVLRILFLWASGLLDCTGESPCVLILETIEQYLFQFGSCGAPPIFAGCLAMMAQHRSFEELHPQSQARWFSIKDILSSIWTSHSSNISNTVPLDSAMSEPTGPSRHSVGTPTLHASTRMSTTATGFYATNGLRTPTLPTKHYSPNNAPFMLGTFSKPVISPTMSPATPAPNLDALGRHSIIHGGRGPPLGHQQQQQVMATGTGNIYAGSGHVPPLDYDALLDDLSTDYIDRIDADPQFMANLGFAPGADITEILSREFGAA